METNNYPKWKHALIYGFYLSIVLIILSLVFYVLDLYQASWTGYVSYAALFGGITISIIYYRNNHLNGFLSYGEGVTIGFLTGLFAGLIAAVYTFIFMKFMGDGMIQELLIAAEENVLKIRPDISDEELDMAMNMTKKMMQPGWMSIMAFFGNALFSLIFALVASIFTKKEEPQI